MEIDIVGNGRMGLCMERDNWSILIEMSMMDIGSKAKDMGRARLCIGIGINILEIG